MASSETELTLQLRQHLKVKVSKLSKAIQVRTQELNSAMGVQDQADLI